MYLDIQQLKQLGLNYSQIARKLNLSRTTVYKYVQMNPDKMNQVIEVGKSKKKKLDSYKDQILAWLKEYPDLSAAQVLDWLLERQGQIGVCESTVRNYVRRLRKQYQIPKEVHRRHYEAVEDPPMGEQMQVDFGEVKLRDMNQNLVRLYFITFVLSHSRYKWIRWQDRPFTTLDVIEAHEDAFGFLGGMTREIVYDQDHLLLVSENHGDLILTHEFASYRRNRNFKIFMCRRQDPESKGRVENVVKYVKRNFAKNRLFINLDKLNEECLAWLDRTGNGKIHGTTKKIPAEVFQEERKHLQPVIKQIKINNVRSTITRQVRKDNTILYEGNRYSVPLGTYESTGKQVRIEVINPQTMVIFDDKTEEEIARHEICPGKGKLIKNTQHTRDRSKGIDAFLEHVVSFFPSPAAAKEYLEEIRKEKPRYIRDQLQLIQQKIVDIAPDVLTKSIDFCLKNRLYRAADFVDALNHYQEEFSKKASPKEKLSEVGQLEGIDPDKIKTKPQIREFKVYQKIMSGGA